MIFTFYSFKGGVGRSMAMANVADLLARRGLKVLTIDFDLEAPGLERYFPVDRESALATPGLMDLLAAFKQSLSGSTTGASADFKNLSGFIFPIYAEPLPGGGVLHVMTAGQRTPVERLRQYALAVRTFDWQDFYYNWEGEAFFEWLRRTLVGPEGLYDVVLVDSRTGVTEMGGICATHLADVVVMLCAANRQNVEGTLAVGSDFVSPVVRSLRRDRPLEVVVVPARIEQDGGERLEQFWSDFESVFKGREPEALRAAGLSFRELAIPYQRELAFNETIVTDPNRRAERAKIGEAFETLTEALMLFVNGERLERHHAQAVDYFSLRKLPHPPSAAELDRLVPTETAVAPQFDPVKRFAGYDGFLSYPEGEGEIAGKLHAALAAAGLEIQLDNSALTPGSSIAESTSQAIHHSRHLLVCAGRYGLSEWQKKEVELARSSAAAIKVVALLLPGAETDIFALSLRGISDLPTIDLRGWPSRTTEFQLLCRILGQGGGSATPEASVNCEVGTDIRTTPVNPYPGLSPHGEALAGVFQATTDVADALIARLNRDHFAVLVGAPGSGKTSLVRTTVLPAVRQGALGEGNSEILWLDADQPDALKQLEAMLDREPLPALIVIDGADEIEAALQDPRLTADADEHTVALQSLLELAIATTRVLLLLGDYPLAAWRSRFQALTDKIQAARVDLKFPEPPQLRSALETAAARSGYAFEPGLLDRIVQEAGNTPAALSLAQMILPTLWQRAQHGFLTNAVFDELKGVSGVFVGHVNKVLAETPPPLAEAVHALLLRLVTVRNDGEIIWQTAVWEHISEQPALQTEGANALLWLLRKRVLTGVRTGPQEFRIEFALQVPLTALPELAALCDEHREFLKHRARLGLALSEWQARGRRKEGLPEGGLLLDSARFMDHWRAHICPDERAFIEAGLRRRQTLRSGGGLALAVLSALIVLGVMWSMRDLDESWRGKWLQHDERWRDDTQRVASLFAGQKTVQELSDLLSGLSGLTVVPHYRDAADAEIVDSLAASLKTLGGMQVQRPQRVDAPTCGDVRVFFQEDRDSAERLRKAVALLLQQSLRAPIELRMLDLTTRKFPDAQRKTIELWLPPLRTYQTAPMGSANPPASGDCPPAPPQPDAAPKVPSGAVDQPESILFRKAHL